MADASETYGINAVAAALERSIVSVRRLERQGVLPPATRLHGRRRYTARDIARLKTAATSTGFIDHPERIDAFRAALAGPPEFDIVDIDPPNYVKFFAEPEPQVRPWRELDDDDSSWQPAPPTLAARPACPECQGPVNQLNGIGGELFWNCPRGHGRIKKPIKVAALSSRGQQNFGPPPPAESRRRRGLMPTDAIGAIRIPKPNPAPASTYLDPPPRPGAG